MDVKTFNQYISRQLWKLRVNQGMSRLEMARIIGVSHQQCEKYEKGINRISAGTLALIMSHYKVEAEYFFPFPGNPEKFDVNSDYFEDEAYEELLQYFNNIDKDSQRRLILNMLRLHK